MRPVTKGSTASYKNAHDLVVRAVRAGRLTKQPCAECGSLASVAHHEDYSKPLDVVWLCRSHHALRHSKVGVIRRSNVIYIVLPADLAATIDDYWHMQRLNSRPDAIRELLRIALETEEIHYALAKEQRRG